MPSPLLVGISAGPCKLIFSRVFGKRQTNPTSCMFAERTKSRRDMNMIDPAELISDKEAATKLHVKPQTLAAWRCEGRGPNWCKIGRRVYYRLSDLQTWLATQVHKPEGRDGARAA